MAITLSEENKNTALTITNESKVSSSVTWDEADFTWDEGSGSWVNPGFPIVKDTKNSLTIANESKNA